MNEPPTAMPALSPAPRPRGFHIPKKLWAVGVLVALGLGGWWYINAPDMPPGGPLAGLDPGRSVSNLFAGGTAPAPSEAAIAASKLSREAVLAEARKAPDAQRAAQLRQQLTSTGLPITAVDTTTTRAGKTALVVGLDASKLTASGTFDPGLASGVDGVIKLVRSKSLDLSATEQVVIAVTDEQGRPLFGIAAPSSAIVQFRDGKISQRDFLGTAAIKAESRAALIDAARRLAAR